MIAGIIYQPAVDAALVAALRSAATARSCKGRIYE